ncbi:MAG: AAA family ATPase [Akkermansiaceae bacterium]
MNPTKEKSAPREEGANHSRQLETTANTVAKQVESQGAHAILQPRAEKNARLVLALQMEEGMIESLEFPIERLPTEPLQKVAAKIHKSLENGRKGWAEVFEDTREQQVIEITQELDAQLTKLGKPNIQSLKRELEEFHIQKTRQLLLWEIQAAMGKGEDISELIRKLSQIEKPSNQTLLTRAYSLSFDPDETPPPDETCMAIGEIPIAARGNLTAVQGKSKVGKSAVVSAVLGAAQRGEYYSEADSLCMEWKGKASGAIIHLDTEQSRADWHTLVNRSVTRSGQPEVSDRLVSLPLVMFARSERLEILRGSLERETESKGGIDAVIIDGIADLCTSPNDEAEALELISQVHALSQQYTCPIYCILHENPGTDQGKTRGHLGSELNRKAFANLRIDKDDEAVSTIYGTDMRKRDLPKQQGFCFAWDDKAGMHAFQGRQAGLKAAQKEAKQAEKERDYFTPLFELIGTNGTCPVCTPDEILEAHRDTIGTEKIPSRDSIKKRMQRAESIGVLRKAERGAWRLNPIGTNGT